MIRDPETYEKFEKIIVTHTCRTVGELQYSYDTIAATREDPLVGEFAPGRLFHFASATRQQAEHTGRITKLIASGEFFSTLNIPTFNSETDRIMLCGSMGMIKDIREAIEPMGFTEGSSRGGRG